MNHRCRAEGILVSGLFKDLREWREYDFSTNKERVWGEQGEGLEEKGVVGSMCSAVNAEGVLLGEGSNATLNRVTQM